METMKTIANRQSCRAYTGEQLTDEELQSILEAANSAPVGMGRYQDVKLTVIQNRELLGKLDTIGAKFFGNPDAHPTYGAPTVILISANNPGGQQMALPYCNAACLVENMALAATNLGLGNVYLLGVIEALSRDTALCQELKVPQGFIPASAIAIGKPATVLKERELTENKIETDYLK